VDDLNAEQLVRLAWDALPSRDRRALKQIGASKWDIVSERLGNAVAARLISAGETAPGNAQTAAENDALGMWVPELRLVLINEAHPAVLRADRTTREALLTWVAWHEWGHALSVASNTPHDLGEGVRLLALAPDGIRERIRAGHYPRREYIHELIAETYALLMRERVEGRQTQPPWLPDEIYQLMARIGT
jgi:hypothetical protein